MKPKNKFQEQIITLSKKLSPITSKQKEWAYCHCFEHIAVRTTKGVCTCLDCGHTWDGKVLKDQCTCPHCGAELKVTDTRKHIFRQREYFCIVTTCQGFQVLRFFYVDARFKKGNPADYYCREAVQRWIREDGKYATVALLRGMCFYYNDVWDFCSKLEIRPDRNVYNIDPVCIYPHKRVIPQIKRNGFKGNFHDLSPFDMFHSILTDNASETLLKARQFKLMEYFIIKSYRSREKYWASTKVCIRNGYIIKDASLWCDYIDLLRFFHKDVHNAKYVCPANLKAEHDRLMEQRERVWERERKERDERRKLEEAERKACQIQNFAKLKSKFFGLVFSDGLIQVHVLESIQEYMEEGKVMHHCVFTNEYYGKADSLILSACANGKRLETVEVSLESLKVVQCHGVCNEDTEYHDRIIALVNKNVPLIRKRMTA